VRVVRRAVPVPPRRCPGAGRYRSTTAAAKETTSSTVIAAAQLSVTRDEVPVGAAPGENVEAGFGQPRVQAASRPGAPGRLVVDAALLHRPVVAAKQSGLEGLVGVRRKKRGLAVVVQRRIEQASRGEPVGDAREQRPHRHEVHERVRGDQIVALARRRLEAGDVAANKAKADAAIRIVHFEAGLVVAVEPIQAALREVRVELAAGPGKEPFIAVDSDDVDRPDFGAAVEQAQRHRAGAATDVEAAQPVALHNRIETGAAHVGGEAALVEIELRVEEIGDIGLLWGLPCA